MRTALITTTINVPHVLSLYRAHDSDVRFFVACDHKTPKEAYLFLESLPNCEFYPPMKQVDSGYKCSELIGWNTIARRNIALLEALKWGAELIVSIDDDNIPLNPYYFDAFAIHWRRNLYSVFEGQLFDGIKIGPGWFDPGSLQFPSDGIDPVCQRGFPQSQCLGRATFSAVTGAKIGIAQGMILGDPDTSAVDRISQHPEVHQVSELLRAGIVTDPRETYAPLNSQNIAFVRELAPCFLMVPAYKRGDDIYAGLVAQRVMREHGYHVHYGQPYCFQQRNRHDLLKDLADEQWASENILEFAAWLDTFLGQSDIIGMLRVMATNLPKFVPSGTQELWLAWLDDCTKVLS